MGGDRQTAFSLTQHRLAIQTIMKYVQYILMLCTRRHVLHTRIQDKRDDIVRENPAQLCEDQTLVFPLGFANGGKPHQFAPWRFVSLAPTVVLVDHDTFQKIDSETMAYSCSP